MNEQPEALRLADALKYRHGVNSFEGDAAAELRRQYVNNLRLREALRACLDHWLNDDAPDELQENVAKFKELCGWEDKACTTTM